MPRRADDLAHFHELIRSEQKTPPLQDVVELIREMREERSAALDRVLEESRTQKEESTNGQDS